MANRNQNIRDIRAMTDDQLLDALEDNRSEGYTLRLQKASGELADPNLIRYNRHNLARLMTVYTERHLAQQQMSKEKRND